MSQDLPITSYALLGLLTFGDDPDAGLTGYELKQRADFTLRFYWVSPAMSQVYSELRRLTDAGLVRRTGSGFALGRKVAELGGAYLAGIDLVQEFYDASRELPAASDETIQLAVLDGLEMTYLARHDGRQQVRPFLLVLRQVIPYTSRHFPHRDIGVRRDGSAEFPLLEERVFDVCRLVESR